MTNVAKVKC